MTRPQIARRQPVPANCTTCHKPLQKRTQIRPVMTCMACKKERQKELNHNYRNK